LHHDERHQHDSEQGRNHEQDAANDICGHRSGGSLHRVSGGRGALSGALDLARGLAIVTNDRGLAVFDLMRHKRGDDAVLIAVDLIERDGEDLRRTPIEQRQRKPAKLVRRPHCCRRHRR